MILLGLCLAFGLKFFFFTLVQDATFVREAAYNLSLIYVLTNATPLADSLYRRWLSI